MRDHINTRVNVKGSCLFIYKLSERIPKLLLTYSLENQLINQVVK